MLSKRAFHRVDFLDILKNRYSNIFSLHPDASFQNRQIDENEYFRNLAMELNNVAVDLYTYDDLSFAMSMYHNAIKAIMTSVQDKQDRTVTVKDAKNVFLNHIVEGKQRLYKITSSSSEKSCTKEGLDSYQWSDSDSGIGPQCISEPIKIINYDEHARGDKEQYVSAAVMMYNVALIHIKKREFDVAEDILELAIGMRPDLKETTETKSNSFIFAAVLNNLGYIQHRINNLDEASTKFSEALDIGNKMLIQSITANSNTDEIETTRRRKHVGTILFNIGVLNSFLELSDDKIKKAFEYSLELQRIALGDYHPDLAIIEHNIGMVYLETGRVNEAERAFLESLKLSRTVHGNDNEYVARELFHLGHLHALKGEYDRALSIYQETYTVQKRSIGENHQHSLITKCEIAKMYHTRGDIDIALSVYDESLAIAKITAGILSIPVASILCKICKIHIERGDIHEAIEIHREVEKKIKYFNRMNIPVDYVEFAQIGHLLLNPPAAGAA